MSASNGARSLLETAAGAGVRVCFANPGTTEMPLVAALGLGLASTVPGRSPLLDGFGLIALASLFPIITVMAYAQLGTWRSARAARSRGREREDHRP